MRQRKDDYQRHQVQKSINFETKATSKDAMMPPLEVIRGFAILENAIFNFFKKEFPNERKDEIFQRVDETLKDMSLRYVRASLFHNRKEIAKLVDEIKIYLDEYVS